MARRCAPLRKFLTHFRGPRPPVASVAMVRDGQVLMVQEASRRWNLPGGRLRGGEDPAEGAIREMREETGLKVQVDALCGIYHYTNRSGRSRVRYVFWAPPSGAAPRCDGREILAARWVSVPTALAMSDAALAKPALLRRILTDLQAGHRHPLGDLDRVELTTIAA